MQNAKNAVKATRTARIAMVANAYRARARNAKFAAHANAQATQQHAAGMLALQQLAAQYGIALPKQGTARANSATVVPSVSTVVVAGTVYKPCKAVHAICATLAAGSTRKQMVAACIAAGINPATASTQVNVYRTTAAAALN